MVPKPCVVPISVTVPNQPCVWCPLVASPPLECCKIETASARPFPVQAQWSLLQTTLIFLSSTKTSRSCSDNFAKSGNNVISSSCSQCKSRVCTSWADPDFSVATKLQKLAREKLSQWGLLLRKHVRNCSQEGTPNLHTHMAAKCCTPVAMIDRKP